MITRGFSKKEIEEAIKMGTKVKQDDKIISVFRDYKVAFKKVKDIYYIITIMYK